MAFRVRPHSLRVSRAMYSWRVQGYALAFIQVPLWGSLADGIFVACRPTTATRFFWCLDNIRHHGIHALSRSRRHCFEVRHRLVVTLPWERLTIRSDAISIRRVRLCRCLHLFLFSLTVKGVSCQLRLSLWLSFYPFQVPISFPSTSCPRSCGRSYLVLNNRASSR